MKQISKIKCNQFLLQKINEDIAEEIHMDLCLNFDIKIKDLNKRLLKLYKIRNFQLFCYEPINKVDNFDAAFNDDFDDWALVHRENNLMMLMDLYEAKELIFIKNEDLKD